MVSSSGAMHYTFSSIATVYLALWNSYKATVTNIYGVLRYVSKAYPPASRFIHSCEKTLDALRATTSESAKPNVSTIIEEFWTPDSVLETLVSFTDYACENQFA